MTALPFDRVRGGLAAGEAVALVLPVQAVNPSGIAFLSPEEQDRATRFRRPGDREAFLAGRRVLRELLANLLEVSDPSRVPLELDARGKPRCTWPTAPAFNLSHAAGWLGVVFAPTGLVGIDLEDPTRAVHAEALASRYFGPTEQQRVREGGSGAFFRVWTRKEACVKALGTGLSVRLSAMDTYALERQGVWRFSEFQPAPSLCACVVTQSVAVRTCVVEKSLA